MCAVVRMVRGGFRVLTTVLITAFVTALLVATASPAQSAPVRYTGGPYVALGDSRASGGFFTPTPGYFAGCKRSAFNYPTLVAAATLPRRFIDASCAGAQAAHLYQASQHTDGGPKTIQVHLVPRDAQLITVSIGGNDMRWAAVLGQCKTPAFTDRRCRHNRRLENEVRWRIELMENRVTPALKAIRKKAPRAQIIVVGLGGFIGFHGCWPLVPLSDPDARWMREVFNRANGALWRATTKVDGQFVDANRRSAGHDACNLINPWYESGLSNNIALPYHVNQAGAVAFAAMINGAIRR
ncbi:SGNH/GDSL hydrolase family protein [Gordonia jinghuaiqii]|uniref:SGNH/GDSL hydrolase family protein n=2 Tax=Gordonia jinghuaiqii TaxID=2758710 RepID=A0A7D7QJ96_9ACTN|nr:SGNH/GDSL hydrolase family protein [Gordonia jinghuaiqii]QMT02924.1 SGNH/GDSL hydrolase family protein [Gordonia jinghuaiqii]